jgi:exodeoxyribonuclease VII large subunit
MPEASLQFNHNQPVYTVSEVSSSIKRVVEERFGVIRIRGEISGWKQASSGHVYFRLKDDNAVIDSICWRGTAGKLSFKPEDGLEVVCTGKITTYPGKSSYQIVVDTMEPAGIGALMALLEKRRKMLEEEGLFDPKRKKPLPFLPRTVGVITSPTGAVIRDILHRIEARFPVHVIVWPVAVQGEGAAEQVAAAIEGFNKLPPEFSAENSIGQGSGLARPSGLALRPDVLIVARGGGSIEDLWAFNEEIVVRAAAASTIPLISAVGHETDTTLIDYASDRRAPTPSAAAEMAVPVREELWLACKQLDARLSTAVLKFLSQRQDILDGFSRGLPKPAQLLQTASQRLDDWSERLLASLPASLARKEQQLALLAAHLRPQVLLVDITKMQEHLDELLHRLAGAGQRMVRAKEDQLRALVSLLESVNYQKVLERGFAMVKDAKGHVVTSAKEARKNDTLSVTFKDGEVVVKAI